MARTAALCKSQKGGCLSRIWLWGSVHSSPPPLGRSVRAAGSTTSWGLTNRALGPQRYLLYFQHLRYFRASYNSITRKQSSKYLVRSMILPSL